MTIGSVAREPLIHFLLIGLLLFVLFGALNKGTASRDIRVDDNVVAALYGQFRQAWQRAPTSNEMNALVDSYVREQIFYREGVALGLDRDDPTITRRVSQKFATIAEEAQAAKPPADADLEQWLKQHADRYAEPPLLTFDQIAFGLDGDAKRNAMALEAARKALAAGVNPQVLGEGHVLLPHYELYPADLVERDFGREFVKALLSLPKGRWEGPVRSGYGIHLVKVEKAIPGQLPKLDQVRMAVARDFEEDRRKKSADATYRKLRESYRVEYPDAWKPAGQ